MNSRVVLTAALTTFALLTLTTGARAWEQTGCFAGSKPLDPCAPIDLEKEEFGEEVQLGGVSAMAVNYTGAGGVPKGTVYAIGPRFAEGVSYVSVYKPSGSGLAFTARWEVESSSGPYQVCGPQVGSECPPNPKGPYRELGIGVDQDNGHVFVYRAGADGLVIVEYAADGSEEIARFGERVTGETIASSPTLVHGTLGTTPGPLAVGPDGEVYLYDITPPERRLMVFEPQDGGRTSYSYAGEVLRGTGISGTGVGTTIPSGPVVDDAGNVYVGGGIGAELFEQFPPQVPHAFPAPAVAPTCEYEIAKSGIQGTTVNPKTGDAFFFDYKKPKGIYHLGVCDSESGEFGDAASPEIIAVSPERGDLWALAFDPVRSLSEDRPAGVIYGGAPAGEPEGTLGKGQPGQSALGYIFAQPIESPPVIAGEKAMHVTQTDAVVGARIDPKGFETHYVFEYETDAAFEANEPGERFAGASSAPAAGANLTPGPAQTLAVGLTGLDAETAYRFRVVATSKCSPSEPEKLCKTVGETLVFRTYPVEEGGLPDERQWELVSPFEKHNGQVYPAQPKIHHCVICLSKPHGAYGFPFQSAPEGNAVAFEGSPFETGSGALNDNQYVSRRDPQRGWLTENPTPQKLGVTVGEVYTALSEDLLSAVLTSQENIDPGSPLAGYQQIYAQSLESPFGLTPLLTELPPNRAPVGSGGAFRVEYRGSSRDLSRVFFMANDSLTTEEPGIVPQAPLVGVGEFNLYEEHAGSLRLVNVTPGNAGSVAGAQFALASANGISTDGSHVFFSAPGGQVYVRIDGTETREIQDGGKFAAAAVDGSRVLLDDGCLYELETENCVDLTEGKGGFEGLAGHSDDLSHVYFADTTVLTGEETNSEGEAASAGQPNLYAYHDGVTTFVATIGSQDRAFLQGSTSREGSADLVADPRNRTAYVSSNGRYLAFGSSRRLTEYDNLGPCRYITPTEGEGVRHYVDGPCAEVFLYDSLSGELRCPSCNPSGAATLGRSVLHKPNQGFLSDSGRLLFDSEDSLLPADGNNGFEDVYQWEPDGVGTCEQADGCLSMISAGTGDEDSNLFVVDASGENVFFTTRDRLRPKDRDELIDLYDARVNGGIPAEEVTAAAPCQGSECQAPATPPIEPQPGSASFTGDGNAAAGKAGCPRGKVKRHGRCVKKKRGKGNRRRAAHRTAADRNGGSR